MYPRPRITRDGSAFGLPGRILGLLLTVATNAGAQQDDTDPYAPVRSIGLPSRGAPYVGVAAVGHEIRGGYGLGGHAFLGYRHDAIQPAIGALGVALEGYIGAVAGEIEAGGRAFAAIRPLRIQLGLVAGTRDAWPPAFALTLEDPVVRGGLLGRGAGVRIELAPGHRHAGLGLTIPLAPSWSGKTRPKRTRLEVPDHPRLPPPVSVADSAITATLEALRASAAWIDLLTTPFVEAQLQSNERWLAALDTALARMRRVDEEFPAGHGYPAEVAVYHRLLRRLFGLALRANGTEVDRLTDVARGVLLNELILPANRHFGMIRDPAVFTAFRARAAARFTTWVDTAALVAPARREPTLAAFSGVLDVVAAVERNGRDRWDDSRLVWLPFQLALRPDEHDSQAEIDALLEQVIAEPFFSGNDYAYLINEAFSPELIRSLHEAREYHVLWIHDFAGVAPGGKVDEVAHRVVVQGYLEALTQRIREFDQTGTLPAFMIFLDRWYFDGRKGRWWMEVLQDPLGREPRLPPEARAMTEEIRAAQRALREAVAASAALQAEAARRGGDWLRRYVKVHVNLTYPADPSFRAWAPGRELVREFPDDFMRDHKKVVFYDLTEEDPARGAALFTGEGVGENYEGATWEDRTIQVRGPAVIGLKREARAVLLAHGIPEHQLPGPLRARPFPADYQRKVDSLAARWTSRVVQVHNATGYGGKYASALKASLYNLMPAGSRILAPDSQWSSFFWAGMLVGSALRGCKVFVIAPRPENAPYGSAFVQNVLTHDVLEGYIQLRQALAEEFAKSGGGLFVGLYGEDIGTRSLPDRYRAVLRGILNPRFPREAFPFPPETFRRLTNQPLLDSVLQQARQGRVVEEQREPRFPKLHLKSQLFMSGDGAGRLLADPRWFDIVFDYVRTRVEEYARDHSQDAAGRMTPATLAPLEPTLRRAPETARAKDVFYLTIGSQNQNDRSLLLDGEILCLVAGAESLGALIDFVAIAARSTWVETEAELDALIPRERRGNVRLARLLRTLF